MAQRRNNGDGGEHHGQDQGDETVGFGGDFGADDTTNPGLTEGAEPSEGVSSAEPQAEIDDVTDVVASGTPLSEMPGAAPEALTDENAPTGAQVLDFASAQEAAGEAELEALASLGGVETGEDDEGPGRVPFEQLETLIEALLFASDRPLSVADIKRLSGERDSRLLNQALEALVARRQDSGVQVVSVANAYSLRTNPRFGEWVSRLVAAKPVRLSRAMLETLAIVAYRQPITRPEIDDVRGVDCGPVLKTLLDRNLVRIIGKREEVGRPMLYGTTPEFLRIFSLKDLTQLPTLRQFHELSAEHQAKVDEEHPAAVVDAAMGIVGGAAPLEPLATSALSSEPGEDDDRLIAELEEASEAASRAAGPLSPEPPPEAAPEPAKTPS